MWSQKGISFILANFMTKVLLCKTIKSLLFCHFGLGQFFFSNLVHMTLRSSKKAEQKSTLVCTYKVWQNFAQNA